MTAGEQGRGYGPDDQTFTAPSGQPYGYGVHPDSGGVERGWADDAAWRTAADSGSWRSDTAWSAAGGSPETWYDDRAEGAGGDGRSGGVPDGPGGPAGPDGSGGPGGRRRRRRDGGRRGLPLWQELPLLLIIALCLAILVRTFLLQAFYIPSGSMEDTLLAGDRVLVNKVVYDFREPTRGEIVVFQAGAWSAQPRVDDDVGALTRIGRALGDLVGISRPGEKDYIKRIIGLPGDRISCCDVEGRVFLNGQPLDESYVTHNAPLGEGPGDARDCRNRRFDEVVVDPGHVFVMGDHRAVSQDSRCQGQVPIDDIIGRAFVIVWPSGRWGGLSAPDVFESVAAAPPAPASAVLPRGSPRTPCLRAPASTTRTRTYGRVRARTSRAGS